MPKETLKADLELVASPQAASYIGSVPVELHRRRFVFSISIHP
ncbi:predicted protein [Sclerotinia sclerotiorum 1980 UF-70]|uniref:Uncharacterized protein n=1 Tax=Sclerotinia sclerotiorum (strain ATCC 18683 / 1980 / Ss-1) TaxID=665079 RepID=A7ED75_SCLS1|nr:predicted protein [Sclerotinia sclerotiorum 1980 UF-70]EDO00791.1 predicted protein [Sclerotinia sclerotiorum 1980 UF-70]